MRHLLSSTKVNDSSAFFILSIFIFLLLTWQLVSLGYVRPNGRVYVSYAASQNSIRNTQVKSYHDLRQSKQLTFATRHHICVIANTHDEQEMSSLNAFLYSMDSQTVIHGVNNFSVDWDLFLLNANGGKITQAQMQALANTQSKHLHWMDVPLELPERQYYLQKNLTVWGYIAIDYALQTLLAWRTQVDSERQSFCDYFLFTNADNLYMKEYFELISKPIDDGYDLIAVRFVNYPLVHRVKKGISETRSYVRWKPRWARARLDLGGVVVSRKCIIGIKNMTFLNHEVIQDNQNHIHDADWYFFERILESDHNYTKTIVNSTLFVHQ